MTQVTQSYKRSLSGSVGAGLGSIFRSSGKQYYILEHKISSKYHKAGETQEIIVNQIEIGRNPRCQVRFDESFPTVSRQHAAIVKEGDKWKLVQLSTTNPTLLNGIKVEKEWYLQTGDEIQLSISGPKLGFIIPTGNRSTVGSIGLSRRLTLFRQQALLPYKWAIILLSLFLLLAIAGGVGYGVWQKKNYDATFDEMKQKTQAVINNNTELKDRINDFQEKWEKDSLANAHRTVVQAAPDVSVLIAAAKKDVYFIETRSYIRDKEGDHSLRTTYGTGFILSDGYFVTARHCVEPWLFDFSEDAVMANASVTTYPNNYKVYSEIRVYSKNSLQFTLNSSDFKINRNNDIIEAIDVDESNQPVRIRFVAPHTLKGKTTGSETMLAHDWAYAKISRPSSLLADYETSTSLHAGEEIHILGFPVGLGVGDGTSLIEPIYNKMTVSRDNLDNAGCIMTSQGADYGNSGGPVFAMRNNRLVVVGIVSRVDAYSNQYNHIVPIKQIK
ncbi:MAG: FHA domain-containing protein [Dysgonamonadaceae bacterium]|jgi:hypothetical protein|nr:FHA domain-containing protein [Dysgonamonadaceae bacterium]